MATNFDCTSGVVLTDAEMTQNLDNLHGASLNSLGGGMGTAPLALPSFGAASGSGLDRPLLDGASLGAAAAETPSTPASGRKAFQSVGGASTPGSTPSPAANNQGDRAATAPKGQSAASKAPSAKSVTGKPKTETRGRKPRDLEQEMKALSEEIHQAPQSSELYYGSEVKTGLKKIEELNKASIISARDNSRGAYPIA